MISDDMKQRLITLFAPRGGGLGASDKAWNMVSLNTQVHRYWSKGFFGLKWVGCEEDPLEMVTDTRTALKGEDPEEGKKYATFQVELH